MGRLRATRVVLAAAHLDHDPTNNRLRNLRSLCQRCHLTHDRPHHLAQRRITYLLRRASGDLFMGPYGVGGSSTDGRSTAAARAREEARLWPVTSPGLCRTEAGQRRRCPAGSTPFLSLCSNTHDNSKTYVAAVLLAASA
jgi:hypothetical protein